MKISFTKKFWDIDFKFLGINNLNKDGNKQEKLKNYLLKYYRLYNEENEIVFLEEDIVKITLEQNLLEGKDFVNFAFGLKAVFDEEYKESLEFFEPLHESYPSNGILCHLLGSVYRRVGKYEEAIALLNTAVRLVPFFYNAYNELGFAYKEIGEHKLAIKNFHLSLTYQHNVVTLAPESQVPDNYSFLHEVLNFVSENTLTTSELVERGKYFLEQGVLNN